MRESCTHWRTQLSLSPEVKRNTKTKAAGQRRKTRIWTLFYRGCHFARIEGDHLRSMRTIPWDIAFIAGFWKLWELRQRRNIPSDACFLYNWEHCEGNTNWFIRMKRQLLLYFLFGIFRWGRTSSKGNASRFQLFGDQHLTCGRRVPNKGKDVSTLSRLYLSPKEFTLSLFED